MDFRKMLEKYELKATDLPKKTQLLIKKFNDSLGMYNKTPEKKEKMRQTMLENMESYNEIIVDGITEYLYDKEQRETQSVDIDPAVNTTPPASPKKEEQTQQTPPPKTDEEPKKKHPFWMYGYK